MHSKLCTGSRWQISHLYHSDTCMYMCRVIFTLICYSQYTNKYMCMCHISDTVHVPSFQLLRYAAYMYLRFSSCATLRTCTFVSAPALRCVRVPETSLFLIDFRMHVKTSISFKLWSLRRYFSVKCEKFFRGEALPLHLPGARPSPPGNIPASYSNPLLEQLATHLASPGNTPTLASYLQIHTVGSAIRSQEVEQCVLPTFGYASLMADGVFLLLSLSARSGDARAVP